ncbi:MAG TPA: hypothetical protein VN039_12170 [Nitrospira sp.]|nr:hypothetical protein [Nitrospira sp.]
MPKSAQPSKKLPQKPWAKLEDQDKAALEMLIAEIGCLEYPIKGGVQYLKHPYFQPRFSSDPTATLETTRRFCEALILWFRKNGLLKDG